MASKAKRGKGRPEQFYVFYNKEDFVECCGTAKQLVEDGLFKNVKYVSEKAILRKQGNHPERVVILT